MIDLAARVEECCGVALETLPNRTRELLAERLAAVDPSQARGIILGLVSVGETMFWRHGTQLDALETYLSKRAGGRSLRVWSAGCASGEEVYTLAALFRGLGRPAQVLGTDVNENALERARAGRYGPWSLRRVPPEWTARWLTVEGRDVVVSPSLREGVSFRVLDLSRGAFPHPQDLIVCRNVLIYFSAQVRAQVFSKFAAALEPSGLLLLAPTDPLPGEGWLEVPEVLGLYQRSPADSCRDSAARAHPKPSATRELPPSPARPRPTEAPPEALAPESTADRVWGLASQGEHGAALESLELALAEQPLDVGMWVQRAIIAEEAGLLDVATDAARRACLLAPGAAAPNTWLGSCLQAMGDGVLAAHRFKLAQRALAPLGDDQVVPFTGGMSAGDLRRLVAALSAGGRS